MEREDDESFPNSQGTTAGTEQSKDSDDSTGPSVAVAASVDDDNDNYQDQSAASQTALHANQIQVENEEEAKNQADPLPEDEIIFDDPEKKKLYEHYELQKNADLERLYTHLFQDEIPKLIAENNRNANKKEMNQPYTTTHKSLSTAPRTLEQQTKPPENAVDMKDIWLKAKSLKYNDRFTTLMRAVLQFVYDFSADTVRALFDSYVKRHENPDLVAYIDFLLLSDCKSFPISKVNNPKFAEIEDADLPAFNLMRFKKARKDLLECVVSTFDDFCLHHTVSSGFECSGSHKSAHGRLFPNNSSNNKNNNKNVWWNAGGGESENKENFDAVDARFTKNEVTPQGSYNFHKNGKLFLTPARNVQNATGATFPLKIFSGDLTVGTQHCYPMFRSLFEKHKNNLPYIHNSALNKECRMLPKTQNTVKGHGLDFKASGTQLQSYSENLPSDNAVFVTRVSTTLKYFQFALSPEDEATSLDPILGLEHQVHFQTLNRLSHPKVDLVTTVRKQCPRRALSKYIAEESLETGFLVQTDATKGAEFIQEFFDNRFFFNVEPTVIFYNLLPEDHHQLRIDWRAIEGPADALSIYLIASTLHGATYAAYNEERQKLISLAAGNEETLGVIAKNFP